VLVVLIPALLCLFVFFLSRVDVLYGSEVERCVSLFFCVKTLRLTGQIPVLFQISEPIDEAKPKEAHSRTGFDRYQYELVFSDEFEVDGRTFWPGELLSHVISFSSCGCFFLFIFVLVRYYSTRPQPVFSTR
jgi:hypothetical protein